jgi:two-component system, NarL family, response regulator NreC
MIRIVIAEDQLIFSEALMALLADVEDIKIVKCVENGQDLLDFLKTEKIDLILTDLKMPVLNGIEATKLVKKMHPSIKVLVLSFYIKERDVSLAMDAGADGYLSKSTSKLEIIEAIESLRNNKPYYSQEVVQVLINSKPVNGSNGIVKLSKREYEVLQLLSKGFSSKQIGVQVALAESTIRTYRNNLLRKFNGINSADLTRKAMESGYLE